MTKINVLIMGAAGRDFHNFNVVYRNNPLYNVAAFTATQIPNIDGRKYPASLAGKLYPKGIPIFPESELTALIKKFNVNQVVFSYSDVPFAYVMAKDALVNAAGADFVLLGANDTMIKSTKPVVSVVASRTGAGKSQTSRKVVEILQWSWSGTIITTIPDRAGPEELLSRVSSRGTWISSVVAQDDQSRGHLNKRQKDFQEGNQDSKGVQKRTSRQEVETQRSRTENFQERSRGASWHYTE